MIYLHRYTTDDRGDTTVDIAVVEDAKRAPPYVAQGFARCTPDDFRAAWRLRDERALAQLRAALGIVEKVAYETAPIGGSPPEIERAVSGGLTIRPRIWGDLV